MTKIEIPDRVREWATDEVYRQGDGDDMIPHFINAWNRARVDYHDNKPITAELIRDLGRLVHPAVQGYRVIPVVFYNGNSGAPSEEIPRLIHDLCEQQSVLLPEDFYYYFEQIHPFKDGNGRVGSILYNYLRRTLENPINPPDYSDLQITSRGESWSEQ